MYFVYKYKETLTHRVLFLPMSQGSQQQGNYCDSVWIYDWEGVLWQKYHCYSLFFMSSMVQFVELFHMFTKDVWIWTRTIGFGGRRATINTTSLLYTYMYSNRKQWQLDLVRYWSMCSCPHTIGHQTPYT